MPAPKDPQKREEWRRKISDKMLIALKGRQLSSEHKENISLALSGENAPWYGKKHTLCTRQKISLGISGKNNPMYGKKHTVQTRKIMSIRSLGKKKQPQSLEHRTNISLALTGKRLSKETKEKLSKCNSQYAKDHPEIVISNVIRMRSAIKNKNTKPERILQAALEANNIHFIANKWFILLSDTKKYPREADIFLPPDTILLCDGDEVHCNPNHKIFGNPNYVNQYKILAKDRWAYDQFTTQLFESNGYTVFRFWESDILHDTSNCIAKIEPLKNV